MKPSQRFALARLARALVRPQAWIDADPPAWDWPAESAFDTRTPLSDAERIRIVRRYNEAWARFVANSSRPNDQLPAAVLLSGSPPESL